MKKRLLCMLLCLLFLIPILTGCGSGAGVETVTLNEAAHTVFYAPLYVAIEKGYFKEKGLKIKLVTGLGSDKSGAALAAGDTDFALMGPEVSIYVYNSGAADYFISFAQLTQRAGDFLVSRNLNEEFTWDNVKGKTILGSRANGMPQMVLEYILKKHGIDPETDLIMITDVDFGLTAQAFSSGQGDYSTEFEPTAASLENAGSGKVAASLGKDSGKVPFTVFSVRKSYMEKHPEKVRKFTEAVQKGLDYINNHTPEEVAKILKPQFSETDRDVLVRILKSYYDQDTWKDNLVFEKVSYTLLEDILIEAGELGSRVPYEKVIFTEYAEKAGSN